MLQVISAVDIMGFYLLFLITIFYKKTKWLEVLQNPVILTILLTSLFAYLIIGYTVPFPGTFIRYKAMFQLLFTCILVVCVNTNKIGFTNISKN